VEQRRQRDFARDIARSQAEAGEGARSSSGGSSSGASGGGGSSNRNAEWAGRVKSAIRENTTFVPPPDMVGNPQVVFRVTLSPDCTLTRVDRINSSGVPSWDQAAERAVRKTNPFPRFPGGQCPQSFELTSRPND
jgi:colicin import membrane protein